MGLMGNGEGHTVVILTDAESRLLRARLESACEAVAIVGADRGQWREALASFNRGIARGTERIAAEFSELQKARKKT